jgi:hypothetical protein
MLYLHDDQAFLIYFGDIFRLIKEIYPSPLKVLEIFSEIDYKYAYEISAAQ